MLFLCDLFGMLILRPYQETIKSKVTQEWIKGHDNVLMVMPTGGGKTKAFVSIAIDVAVHPKDKIPTAIMVHRKELVQQISLTLAEEGVIHNIIAPRKTINGIIAAQRKVFGKAFYDYSSYISVISVDTLNARILKHEKWAKSIKLWITDEAAHLLKKNKWGRAVSYFPNAQGLGVTAVPERLDKKGLGRHADGVFDVMVEGPTTRWMIIKGYLCKYKIAVPKSDYQSFLRKSSGNSDYSKDAMIDASKKSQIIGDVVENYIKFANGKQAILFATDVNTAEEMEAKFNEADIKAKFLHAGSTDQERLQGLIDFRNKKIQVLINVDLFDEGLDVPGIECVIMARPTMSLSKYLQMCGRGLRPADDKDFLIIIDHVGNCTRHGYPDAVRTWTLDRIVNSRNKRSLMRVCSNPACASMYERELTECPWCGEPAISNGGGGGRVPPEMVDGDLYLIDPMTLNELETATDLEAPGKVSKRVTAAAGGAAGLKAMNNQIQRINVQKDLGEVIAQWAGVAKSNGLSNREIHKLFFIEQGRTISQTLSEPKADMTKTILRLGGENET